MKLHRLVTATSALLGLVLSVGTLGTAASAAPPIRPGVVANLTLSATAAPGGGYAITSTWSPAENATS